MKAIQKELGDMDDAPNEMEELQQKVEEAGMPKEARDKAESELKKTPYDVTDVRRGNGSAQLR